MFVISLAESLAVVGVAVPGVAIMFGIGTLIGTGTLEFWSTAAWAVAGAIAGDGLSFWLGRHYRDTLRGLWPFRTHPAMLERGEAFFQRFGGKSIVLGRFVGPVRAITPLVAGMLDMAPSRFLAANIASALAWAPAYLMPGMLFGASLELASEVAGRLAVLILLLLALVWFILWLVRRLFNLLQPHAHGLVTALLRWGEGHPRISTLSASLADPNHPEARGLTVLATFLLLGTWLFIATLATVLANVPLAAWDRGVYQLLQSLRTPWIDGIMVGITQLADAPVLWPLMLAVLGLSLWRRNRSAAGHWVAAAAFGLLASALLKYTLQIPRPGAGIEGLSPFSFPSGHTLHAGVLFGFLAVMIAREMPAPQRWIPYSVASLLVTAVALSRIYLGAHWLSDSLGSLGLALAWISLLGIAYRSRPAAPLGAAGLTFTAILTLAVAGTLHIGLHHEREVNRYTPQHALQRFDERAWWTGDWRHLPAYRNDLRAQHNHPLTLQWAGHLRDIRRTLTQLGWKAPQALTTTQVMLYLNPHPELAILPVLPQVHDGRHEALQLIRDTEKPGRRLVLRLWDAHTRLGHTGTPLWMGNVAYQRLKRAGSFFAYAQTGRDFDQPLNILASELPRILPASAIRHVRRAAALQDHEGWDGSVLLVRE